MKNDFITITLSNGERQSFALDLKELELKNNSSIENLDAFILLQDLEKITIINCENFKDLLILDSFKKLRKLTIENCDSITDLSSVNNVPSLRRLKCRFQNLEVLRTLNDNPYLKILSLTERNCISRFELLQDNFLIVKFITPEIIDLSPIESLHQITKLEVLYSNYLKNINTLNKVNNMQFICLSHCTELSNLNPLKNLDILKELELSNCDKIKNTETLFEIKQLEILNIIECYGISTINIKNDNFSIKSLTISGCKNLSRINQINKLKSLHQLQIESYLNNFQ